MMEKLKAERVRDPAAPEHRCKHVKGISLAAYVLFLGERFPQEPTVHALTAPDVSGDNIRERLRAIDAVISLAESDIPELYHWQALVDAIA